MNRRILAAACAASLLLVSTLAAADWPQFRGPNRDGLSPETGLLKSWPKDGPKLLWTATGCGQGYSSPVIVGDKIFTLGDVDGKGCLITFSLDGKPGKTVPFCAANPGDLGGTHSTPTVEGGMVYCFGPHGDLACFNAKTLEKVWAVNVGKKFKGGVPQWQYSESPLVDGENVICCPGGPNAAIVALNKKTGETVWTSKGHSDPAAYSSAILMTVDKLPMIVAQTAKSLVGVNAATGAPLWHYKRPANGTANAPSPVFSGNRVFEATGYGQGGGAVDLTVSGGIVTAAPAWETKDMDCHHGGYVLVNGYIYGNNGGGWACLDFKTGQTKWQADGIGKGCVIYADGLLYTLGEGNRKVGLVKATPEALTLVSEFTLPGGDKGSLWAHPAIANGRLYVRYGDTLYCYDIKQ